MRLIEILMGFALEAAWVDISTRRDHIFASRGLLPVSEHHWNKKKGSNLITYVGTYIPHCSQTRNHKQRSRSNSI